MKTILFIEDTIEILENLTEFFELEGYNILGTNNGKHGIELASEFMPNLIVCDVRMREMDGHAVLYSLLSTAKTQEIPFIFSTSMSETMNRKDALNLGADDYIIKPFELETLLVMAKAWIKSGTRRSRLFS